MKLGKGAETERQWAAFTKRYRAEMAEPEAGFYVTQRTKGTGGVTAGVSCAFGNAKGHRRRTSYDGER